MHIIQFQMCRCLCYCIRTTENWQHQGPRLKIMLRLFVCNHSFAYSRCTAGKNIRYVSYVDSSHRTRRAWLRKTKKKLDLIVLKRLFFIIRFLNFGNSFSLKLNYKIIGFCMRSDRWSIYAKIYWTIFQVEVVSQWANYILSTFCSKMQTDR